MNWPRLRKVLATILLILSVSYVVWHVASDDEALSALRSISPIAAIGLIVLQGVYLLPQALRYRISVEQASNTKVPLAPWLRLFVIGRFLNTLIPQAGNAYRGVRLREDYGIPLTRYLGGYVAFTWLSTLLNLAVASVLIASLEPLLQIGGFPALAVTTTLFCVIVVLPPITLRFVRRFPLDSGVWGWAYRRTVDLLASATSILRNPPVLARFLAVSLAGLTVALIMFKLAVDALELEASLSTVVLFYVILQLATYVNVTPGNLGVLEIGFGALGSQLGIGFVGGILIAAVMRISGTVALLTVGASLGSLTTYRQLASKADR